jgi:hypothetical protein
MKRFYQWVRKYPILFLVAFAAVYMLWFYLLEKFREPVLMVHSSLDDKIPFCEYFVIPYLLWFLYIAFTFLYFFIKERESFYHACRYMFTGMIICLMIYTIVPTGLQLRPEITNNNFCSALVSLIYSVDTSTNVCPSIHVFNSIAVNTVIQHSEVFKHKRLVHVGSYILAIAICISTVMLKQHSVIDVFWGCVLGILLYPLSYRSLLDDEKTSEYKIHIS